MLSRLALGTLLVLHGLIHALGFVAYWRLAEVENLPYSTSLLDGNLPVGEVGAWAFGLLWLVAAVGFSGAGLAVFTFRTWWRTFAFGVALLSLTLTILGWPASWFGVLVNLGILAYLLVGSWMGWLPGSRPSRRLRGRKKAAAP